MAAHALALPGVVYAEANWGRWIGSCISPYCRSALQVNPGQPGFRCWDCGTATDIVWPANTDDIERLLTMRPDPATRNWTPGEDLHDLMLENAAHGIFSSLPELDTHPGGPLLQIVGDHITADALTSNRPRLALGG